MPRRVLNKSQILLRRFLHLQTRSVLAINHVFNILLAYKECGDWQNALITAIPPRKGVTVRDDEGSDNDNGANNAKAADDDADATNGKARDVGAKTTATAGDDSETKT